MDAARLNTFIKQKDKERLLAFAPIQLDKVDDLFMFEGVLNIAERRDGKSGFLVLSCILDVPNSEKKRKQVRDRFKYMKFPKTPPGFQTALRTEVLFQKSSHILMEELTFSFSDLAERQEMLLTQYLIPALKRCGFSVGEIEWFEAPKRQDTSLLKKISELQIVKLFQ